jgi:mannose-6-phosphate isomerase-like protein (cupin superfamily)
MEDNVRPWGRYDILYNGEDCKVKRITVKPGGKLSYQYHYKRSEIWTVISGNGFITLDDDTFYRYPGQTIHIPCGAKHRIENKGDVDLVFVEVQTGTYFGEDDIVRLEDDYGRT